MEHSEIKTKTTKGGLTSTIFVSKQREDGFDFERLLVEQGEDCIAINVNDIDLLISSLNRYKKENQS